MLVGLPFLGQDLTSKQEAIEVCSAGVELSDLWIADLVLAGYIVLIAIYTVIFFESPNKRLREEQCFETPTPD